MAGHFVLVDLSCKHKHKANFLTSAKIFRGFNLTFKETTFLELRPSSVTRQHFARHLPFFTCCVHTRKCNVNGFLLLSIFAGFSTVSVPDHFLRHPELHLFMVANLQKVAGFWQYMHTEIVKECIYINYLWCLRALVLAVYGKRNNLGG